jgi:GNAT superfamily N-acetyltransferase
VRPVPDVTVRRLGTADWPALKAVRLAALTDAPQAFESTLAREQAYTDERWQEWLRSTAAVFGAFTGAERARTGQQARTPDAGIAGDAGIVGVAAAGRRPGAGPAGADRWLLMSMWVAADWRGAGVADCLAGAVCDYVRAAGADRICLWVTDGNDRAGAFYGRLGFAPTGRHQVVRPGDPDLWETELARPLGPAGNPGADRAAPGS